MKNESVTYKKGFRRSTIYLALWFICCSLPSMLAQTSDKEVSTIENAVTSLYKAMVNKDETVLKSITMDNLTYGHSSGKIENKSEYIDGVMNGAFQFSSIIPVDQTISTSGKVSIVRHIFKGKGTNNGSPAEVNIGCMLVFQKQGKDYKLLARQAYKL